MSGFCRKGLYSSSLSICNTTWRVKKYWQVKFPSWLFSSHRFKHSYQEQGYQYIAIGLRNKISAPCDKAFSCTSRTRYIQGDLVGLGRSIHQVRNQLQDSWMHVILIGLPGILHVIPNPSLLCTLLWLCEILSVHRRFRFLQSIALHPTCRVRIWKR